MSMQRVGEMLPGLLRELGLAETLDGWRAVADWSDTVGPQIAKRTRAVSFRDGALVVEVDGSAWMHELGFLARDLRDKLNERLGRPLVRDIKFTITRGGIRR